MPSLAKMIDHEQWDDAYAYVRLQQNAIVPEVRAIVSDPRTSSTTMEIAYGFLRKVPTLESAMLLAQGFSQGGGQASVLGLIENPRSEVYPILKGQMRPPAKEGDRDLLLTMAQIPVPPEQRIADLKPYLAAANRYRLLVCCPARSRRCLAGPCRPSCLDSVRDRMGLIGHRVAQVTQLLLDQFALLLGISHVVLDLERHVDVQRLDEDVQRVVAGA